MKAAPSHVFEFGDFRLDVEERQLLRRDGAPFSLTPRVFETLHYLVEHRGRVLDKETLMEAVWPDCIVEENNLAQNISTLRRVFGDTPGSQRYIATVAGRGYRFVPDVKFFENGAVESPLKTDPAAGEDTQAAGSTLSPRNLRSLVVAAIILLVIGATVLLFRRSAPQAPRENRVSNMPSTAAIPEKSIAVLPFANLSADQENAFFTEGMQDDILTAISRIADLKVISRTSVATYLAGQPRNFREIRQELGVSQILEGSVRRAGDRVRVTVQLIDTGTNAHLWADTYDRGLTDVFAIQSDIAQQIAAALKAKLAPEEKTRLDARPTTNSEAYVLYLTALGMDDRAADKLFMQATALDPGFALAYARASISLLRNAGEDASLKARARAQAQEAMRLSPNLGEAHMAVGLSLYWGEKRYDAALKEFEIAAATLPNSAEIPGYVGGIYRRQGRWREATASFARAQALDPRNERAAYLAANHYLFMREWDAAAAGYKRSLEVGEDQLFPHLSLAYIEVARNADTAAARRILDKVPAGSRRASLIDLGRWNLAMFERDYAAAEKALDNVRFEDVSLAIDGPKTYYQGRTALARGDVESARRYFEAATLVFEGGVRDDPDGPQAHAALGLVYAYRQMKEEAIRESRRAIELEPETSNAYHGAVWVANLAVVFALVGESDQAITLLEHLLTIPGPVQGLDYPRNITLGDLRLRWEWDRLRNHPRFQKLLAGPEPKTVY